MTVPVFPEFQDIDLSMKNSVEECLSGYPLEASEYTFTNLFAFRDAYNFRLSLLNNNLLILRDAEPFSMFCPVGGDDIPDVLHESLTYLKEKTGTPCLERIPESFVNNYLSDSRMFSVEEERDHFDYIYDVRDLTELTGRKFHDKKNKVNKFRSTYAYEYLSLTPELIGECLEFEDYWCETRECWRYYGLHKERCAILEMLNNFEALNITGGIVKIEGKIAALTLGEKYLPDYMVIHIEKAHSDIPGLYQVINQEFLMHEADDCQFVNREQDLGIAGLRKSKLSYNPVSFIRKYKVREKQS